mmetsp:Transcript_40225/g.86302  ORF Transcript_40225/g.86302 Transcript_40225/m.86302 type:complete len:152 (-) Transcript_40225:776-1231(-)
MVTHHYCSSKCSNIPHSICSIVCIIQRTNLQPIPCISINTCSHTRVCSSIPNTIYSMLISIRWQYHYNMFNLRTPSPTILNTHLPMFNININICNTPRIRLCRRNNSSSTTTTSTSTSTSTTTSTSTSSNKLLWFSFRQTLPRPMRPRVNW